MSSASRSYRNVQQGGWKNLLDDCSDHEDMQATTPAVLAMKKLSLLEPDLIMPAIMERAVSSLQGLEEVG